MGILCTDFFAFYQYVTVDACKRIRLNMVENSVTQYKEVQMMINNDLVFHAIFDRNARVSMNQDTDYVEVEI